MNVMILQRPRMIQCQHPFCGWRGEREFKIVRVNVVKRAVGSIVLMIGCVAISFVISHLHPSPGPIILSTLPIALCSLVLSFGVALVCTSAKFASPDSTNGTRHLVRCQRWCTVASFLTKVTFLMLLPTLMYFIFDYNVMMLVIHPSCFLTWLSQKRIIQNHLERAAEKFEQQQHVEGEAPANGVVQQQLPSSGHQIEITVNPLPNSESDTTANVNGATSSMAQSSRHPNGRLSVSTQVPARSGQRQSRSQPTSRSRNTHAPGARPTQLSSSGRGRGSQLQEQEQEGDIPSPTPSTAPPPSYAEVVDERGASGCGARLGSDEDDNPSDVDLPPSYSQTQLNVP